jgi:hypothetical protein
VSFPPLRLNVIDRNAFPLVSRIGFGTSISPVTACSDPGGTLTPPFVKPARPSVA